MLCLLARRAHHHQIVRVADDLPCALGRPCPVEPVQIDVAEQWGHHASLRRASVARAEYSGVHDPGAQHRAQELQDLAVNDPFLDRRHQPLVRDRLKTVGDIRLGHPPPAPPGLVNNDLECVVSRAPEPKPERALEHVSFEDRLDHRLQRRLHDAVTDRRDRQRPLLC